MNSKIPCMRQCHWRCHQTFFSDYWLCKIPWNEILTTWLYQRPWKIFFSSRRTLTSLKSLSERQFIIGKPIDHTLLIMVVNPHYNSIVFVLFIFFFFESYMLILSLDDEHRVSKEGKSSCKESYTVDSHWKMVCDVIQPNVA